MLLSSSHSLDHGVLALLSSVFTPSRWHLFVGLIAFTHQPKKPSLNLLGEDSALLPILFQYRIQVNMMD
jgi:hypothetical protein